MGEVQELHLRVKVAQAQEPNSPHHATVTNHHHLPPPTPILKHWKWWFMVSFNVAFLLVGQSTAILLGTFYYDQGGNSKRMATFVQTAAFPILLIPLYLFSNKTTPTTNHAPSSATLGLLYLSLGLLLAADNLMYSYGLLYVPVSTYSLICASQLAFNAVFSYLLNSQKFTAFILNSVVVLTLSATLLGVHADSTGSAGIFKGKYAIGFVCTLGASATYSLLLSLMQLSFQKVLRRETFKVVLEMQIYTALVATCACVVGLFASGEWRSLKGEMEGFGKGKVSYVMTLAWTAVAWQVGSVGVVGLIFVISSLFSNAVSTFALPIVPILSVIFFKDKMDGVKVVAMLMSIWGFVSCIYQHFLDDSETKRTTRANAIEVADVSVSG